MSKIGLSIAAAVAVFTAATAAAQSVEGTIPLRNLPEQVAVNPINNHVYVAVPNFGTKPFDYLTIIDGKTDTVIHDVQIPPVAYAVSVDTYAGLIYVGGSYEDRNGVVQNNVVVVNEENRQVIAEIHLSSTEGDGIQALAVNAANGSLYVTNASDNEVDVVRGQKLQKRIAIGNPWGVAINPLLNRIYIATLDGKVAIIDGKTDAVVATTSVGEANAGIAVDVDTGKVFTTNATAASTVGVLDDGGKVLANTTVGSIPMGIDVDPGTHLVFVADSQDETVSVVNGATNKTVRKLPVSGLFLAVNPAMKKVYVGSNNGSHSLTVIGEP